MQAPDSPRRPIRLMQRTRGSCRASPRTTSQVPSGELSSTKMTSKAMPASAVSSRRNSVKTLSRSLKEGTTTESAGKAMACGGFWGPGLMASFMRAKRISAPSGEAKAELQSLGVGREKKRAKKRPQNANDHEQRARVHPAQPSYSVVVPAPELSSIDVAVGCYIGAIRTFRKRQFPPPPATAALL